MPILDVQIVGPAPRRRDLAAALARAAAQALASRPDGTWVRVRRLPARDYAEGDGGPPRGVRPVFVTVLLADVPPPRRRAEAAARLTDAVAEVVGRAPGCVHVLFEPPAAGRIAFGGTVYRGAAAPGKSAARSPVRRRRPRVR